MAVSEEGKQLPEELAKSYSRFIARVEDVVGQMKLKVEKETDQERKKSELSRVENIETGVRSDFQNQIASYSAGYGRWESVRLHRSMDVVGQPSVIVEGKILNLQPTGFEGYFKGRRKNPDAVGAEKEELMTPEDIIKAEVQLGKRIYRKIQDIGNRNYDHGRQPTVSVLRGTLSGKGYSTAANDILNKLFVEVLTEERSNAKKQNDPKIYAEFREMTEASVSEQQSTIPVFEWKVDNDNTIKADVNFIPKLNTKDHVESPRIKLTKEELRYYQCLADIGKFGNPFYRAMLSLEEIERFRMQEYRNRKAKEQSDEEKTKKRLI